MSSDSQLGFASPEEFFCHLESLFHYASVNIRNESSIYGALSFILTIFCASARVTAKKFKNLYLGTFPQKDLKLLNVKKAFQAPDFSIVVVQSNLGQQSTENEIGDMGALIWEVKTSPGDLSWFGKERSKPLNFHKYFFRHFHQIGAQVVFAKAKFNQKPIYALLSIDIWFILFYFPGAPPSLQWSTGKRAKSQLDHKAYLEFDNHIVISPARMVNEDCTAFSPEFLYALQLSVEHLADVTVTPHPLFRPPEGTAELVSAQLKKQWLRAEFKEEIRHVEIDNKFALGEEDTDERSSMGWSASEETETDLENQKHSAAVPTTLDHLLTSPAQTRTRAAAAKSRTPAATQSGTPNKTANIVGPLKTRQATTVNPMSAGKASLPVRRSRRKAAQKTTGYQKDVDE
ncbi:hypothetical protein OG21DRAFT_1605257 [Imleria badia]|nr:hypothetical protein OG21DRAFT_1605257 [Imleria badia]